MSINKFTQQLSKLHIIKIISTKDVGLKTHFTDQKWKLKRNNIAQQLFVSIYSDIYIYIYIYIYYYFKLLAKTEINKVSLKHQGRE
jgi:hypothetical protein